MEDEFAYNCFIVRDTLRALNALSTLNKKRLNFKPTTTSTPNQLSGEIRRQSPFSAINHPSPPILCINLIELRAWAALPKGKGGQALARIRGSLDAGRRAGSRESPRDNWYQRLVGKSSYEEMSGDMTRPVEREEPDCGESWSFGEGHALRLWWAATRSEPATRALQN
ncbi:hypothetical protein LguiB_030092 [Lonicera macranthoides]